MEVTPRDFRARWPRHTLAFQETRSVLEPSGHARKKARRPEYGATARAGGAWSCSGCPPRGPPATWARGSVPPSSRAAPRPSVLPGTAERTENALPCPFWVSGPQNPRMSQDAHLELRASAAGNHRTPSSSPHTACPPPPHAAGPRLTPDPSRHRKVTPSREDVLAALTRGRKRPKSGMTLPGVLAASLGQSYKPSSER